MNNRAVEIAGFLAQNGWDDADQIPFDADFSPRRYARLLRGDNRRAVLMDADKDQKTDEFIVIAKLLRSLDIAAPEIYAASPAQGLVLMENLGSRNFGNTLDAGAEKLPLYLRATDVLVHLHKVFDPTQGRELDLPLFGGALFAAQVELFLDYYFPHAKDREATRDEGEAFRDAWRKALKGIEALPQSLMLRDFMPDNLMDLSDRATTSGCVERGASTKEDWRSVGVLDFQDAGLGPIAYDLASLCEEVRRDGGAALLKDIVAHYHRQAAPPLTVEELMNACRTLSAQRHMRVLGIIARLAQKTGRQEKLAYIPRIWKHLETVMAQDNLQPLRQWCRDCGFLTV